MNKTTIKHVIVGLSGGVDSAVAALLLQQQGYRVSALFMKNWEDDDAEGYCAAAEDLKVARQVCAQLRIPLHTVNFSTEYWDRVFQYFLDEYGAGRTPNPDVLCNKEIKFKAFLEHALNLGADAIATGHYARIAQEHGQYRLLRAKDDNKDQSYFLYMLGQHALSHTLFPLGELDKSEVRELARNAALPNHDRKDSTGICFIGERHFKSFLQRYLPAQPGEIRSATGELKGHHDGLMYHTIGQRHGLGIGGPGAPWYVAHKDLASNTLIVVQGEDHPALYRSELLARDCHWVSGTAPTSVLRCEAKSRYRQPQQACTLTPQAHGAVLVQFEQAQRALTPGQSVVFYQDETCLGGGIIQALDHSSMQTTEHQPAGSVLAAKP